MLFPPWVEPGHPGQIFLLFSVVTVDRKSYTINYDDVAAAATTAEDENGEKIGCQMAATTMTPAAGWWQPWSGLPGSCCTPDLDFSRTGT